MFFYSESDGGSGGASLADWLNTAETKLTASDAASYDWFGGSVSISGDGSIMAVGASKDSSPFSKAGSVYVFQNTNGVWTEVQKLTASDAGVDDYFGGSVSISSDGSTIVVGASFEDPSGVSKAGSVYVFQSTNGVWAEVQKLTASDKTADDRFGQSVSISGDGSILAVGAHVKDTYRGATYIFQNTNGVWTEVQKLTASDRETYDQFGWSTSISEDGSTIAVGAYAKDSYQGAAYIFQSTNGVWTEVQKLTASDKAHPDQLGYSISISSDGSTIAVGAYGKDSYQGVAYIFQNTNDSWVEVQKLTASDKTADDRFGYSISISSDGSTIAVGAYYEDPSDISNAGSAYVFQSANGNWGEVQILTASDKVNWDQLGHSISISGDGSTIAVGAFAKNAYQGAVYAFQAS